MNNLVRDWETAAGYRAVCLLLRPGHSTEHFCGYVAIPKEHPLFGARHNDEIPEKLIPYFEQVKQGNVGKRGVFDLMLLMVGGEGYAHISLLFDVHGSITYSEGVGGSYPAPGDDIFWYGFDCAHSGDTIEMCNQEYVEKECEFLARQLRAVAENQSPPMREAE